MKKPLPQPLDAALKEHYNAASLSPQQTDRLLALQAEAAQAHESNEAAKEDGDNSGFISALLNRFLSGRFTVGGGNYRYAFHVTAALLLLSLGIIFSLLSQPPLSQRIMDEIAYNHQQKMPIEVASASLGDVRNYLNKLTFPIISPASLDEPNWRLLGGRYCSINGKLAAQLKIKNTEDNSIYTLYQAATEGGESALGQSQMTQTIDGVGVSIWREKGLLLGLASSP